MRTAIGTGDQDPAEDPDYLILVPSLPSDEARAAWHSWQSDPDARVPLDQVTCDVFRGDDGQQWRRYRVHRSALPA